MRNTEESSVAVPPAPAPQPKDTTPLKSAAETAYHVDYSDEPSKLPEKSSYLRYLVLALVSVMCAAV